MVCKLAAHCDSPSGCKVPVVAHDAFAEVLLGLGEAAGQVKWPAEHVVDLVAMHHAHPVAPKGGGTALSKIVVVDGHAVLGHHVGEVVRGADEEVVAHHVANHLLVEVAVRHVLPCGVLHELKTRRN
jgi:hypothetical protein